MPLRAKKQSPVHVSLREQLQIALDQIDVEKARLGRGPRGHPSIDAPSARLHRDMARNCLGQQVFPKEMDEMPLGLKYSLGTPIP
jgi:hypothetical protein